MFRPSSAKIRRYWEKDAFFAAGSMVSFLTNCGFITEGEDIFNQRFTSEVAAGFLVKTTIKIINSTGIFYRPTPEDLGKRRTYLLFLSAVMALFLDFLFSRRFKESFGENIERATRHLREMKQSWRN